jgi:hypothetical protein
MRRRWSLGSSLLIGALLAMLVTAGCNGEGRIDISGPPSQPHGPDVTGQVQLPNGQLAQVNSLWPRLHGALVPPAHGLFVGSVRPVGPGVEVQLVLVGDGDVVDGEIPGPLAVIDSAETNGNGQYQLFLPQGGDPNACRHMVQVGRAGDGTLTRAFVYRAGPVDINFASEATVRAILAALGPEASLCNFESNEIGALYESALAAAGAIPGDTVEEVNANAEAAVAADADFQALLAAAALPGPLPPTHTATATSIVSPTPSATPAGTATSTPTRTPTLAPTATPGPPTATATPRPTSTPVPTRTSTTSPEPTSTAPITATNTPPIAPTNTPPIGPTNTPPIGPTDTPPIAPTDTPPIMPGTSTPVPTTTPTQPTPTSTPVTGASVDLGTVAGMAGMTVSLPVTLVGTGIVAVANDIEFGTDSLDVVMVDGRPDCEPAPAISGNKRVVAGTPPITGLPAGRKVLRVGVIGVDNNDVLPSGLLYACRFAISVDAPMGPLTLLNTPDASDALGNAVAVGGSDGTITVTPAAPSLNFNVVVGTAGETVTVTGTLAGRGQVISALATDVSIDDEVLGVVTNPDQTPACVADEGIGLSSDLDKEVFAAVLPATAGDGGSGTPGRILRVGLVARSNNAPLPDGPMFHCQLAIAETAPPQVAVLEYDAEGSTPDGMSVSLAVGTGLVVIVEP